MAVKTERERERERERLTADQHCEYGEDFLGVVDGGDVAEADASDDGEGEIQRRDVA